MHSALAPTGLVVLVPCHNCAEFIVGCLRSILDQDFGDWRLLVADDASTDGTADLAGDCARDPRVRVRRGFPRAHLMGNILAGLDELAPGPADVVAVVDGDDELLPGAFSAIMAAHAKGFDLVYTDMEVPGAAGSIGAQLLPGIPPRAQAWCLSHLRSFKGYLLESLRREDFLDADGNLFRAAGDLSLYLPMAEAAGPGKTLFLPEKRYRYRLHPGCNCVLRRDEQLANNALIRSRPPLAPQTRHFDFRETVRDMEKTGLRALGEAARARYPRPCTVRLDHALPAAELDSWRAYHDLWIAEGVYLAPLPEGE